MQEKRVGLSRGAKLNSLVFFGLILRVGLIFLLVEEIFNIYKSVFYIILRHNRQVNLAMKDDEMHFMF